MQFLFHYGHEHINRDGDPDLGPQSILGSAVEILDAQVLLDPFEEQLDLPTAAIKLGDSQGWQAEVVGQKDESLIGLRVEITNTAQLFGIAFAGYGIDERNSLIADDSRSSVYWLRVESLEIETLSGPGDKEAGSEVQFVQAREIEVTAIHHIERAGFEAELIQNVDLVNLAMCNDHNSWNAAAQVEQRVQFHRSFVLAKHGPGEKGQAQIDGGGIERVNRLGQLYAEAVVCIERSGAGNQHLREVGVDAPVAHRIRMGQGIARDLAANAEMVKLGVLRAQASFDIAQTLAIG